MAIDLRESANEPTQAAAPAPAAPPSGDRPPAGGVADRLPRRVIQVGVGLMDGLIVAFAFLLATGIRFSGDFERLDATDLPQQALLVAMLMIAGLARHEGYEVELVRSGQDVLTRVVLGVVTGLFLIVLTSYVVPELAPGRGVFALHTALTIPLLLAWRRFVFRELRESALRPRALLLGEETVARKVGAALAAASFGGADVAGILVPPGAVPASPEAAGTGGPGATAAGTPGASAVPVLGDYARLREVAAAQGVGEIVVVAGALDRDLPVEEILTLRRQGVRVEDGSTVYEGITGKLLVEKLTPGWLVFANAFERSEAVSRIRELVGAGIALVGLIAISPLLAAVAIAIKLESPGPVIFRQRRVGERGKIFEVLKFRSMRQDAEAKTGAVWAQQNDPRVTRIGRIIRNTRIDELPQLWNVVRGDMAFVGPRPERPEFCDQLRKIIPHFDQRHTVKPGITGWAQINYRYGASVEDSIEKLHYDLYYVQNTSAIVDIDIVLGTIRVMLGAENQN